jgi:hypothetical protein
MENKWQDSVYKSMPLNLILCSFSSQLGHTNTVLEQLLAVLLPKKFLLWNVKVHHYLHKPAIRMAESSSYLHNLFHQDVPSAPGSINGLFIYISCFPVIHPPISFSLIRSS